MQILIKQLLNFSMVGFFCFFIDFGITMLLKMLGVHYLVAGVAGFVISVVVNYILSFRFVFQRKDDLNRVTEFVIFVVLSVIGLGVNEAVMWVGVDMIYMQVPFLKAHVPENSAVAIAKIAATAVVMVYNFVTRKIFLEKKPKELIE